MILFLNKNRKQKCSDKQLVGRYKILQMIEDLLKGSVAFALAYLVGQQCVAELNLQERWEVMAFPATNAVSRCQYDDFPGRIG